MCIFVCCVYLCVLCVSLSVFLGLCNNNLNLQLSGSSDRPLVSKSHRPGRPKHYHDNPGSSFYRGVQSRSALHPLSVLIRTAHRRPDTHYRAGLQIYAPPLAGTAGRERVERLLLGKKSSQSCTNLYSRYSAVRAGESADYSSYQTISSSGQVLREDSCHRGTTAARTTHTHISVREDFLGKSRKKS